MSLWRSITVRWWRIRIALYRLKDHMAITPHQRKRVADICKAFLQEAAVLIFVFPLLDTIIHFGRGAVTGKWLLEALRFPVLYFWERL